MNRDRTITESNGQGVIPFDTEIQFREYLDQCRQEYDPIAERIIVILNPPQIWIPK